jgi:hypothetical protein
VTAIGILLFRVGHPKLGEQRYRAISIAGKSVAAAISGSEATMFGPIKPWQAGEDFFGLEESITILAL